MNQVSNVFWSCKKKDLKEFLTQVYFDLREDLLV